LSDSTESYDRGKKFEHYRQIPTLREYLLVSQKELRIEPFVRGSEGEWRLAKPPDGRPKWNCLPCKSPSRWLKFSPTWSVQRRRCAPPRVRRVDPRLMPRETAAAKAARTKNILAGLQQAYPNAHCELNFASPLQLLIATILSAQCTDKRVNMVTAELFQSIPGRRTSRTPISRNLNKT